MIKIKNILKSYFNSMFSHINPIFADVYITKCVNDIKKLPEIIKIVHIKDKPITKYKLMSKQSGVYAESEESCFVVAGGPSLKGFDFTLLKDQTTFVSNKTIFDVPNANYFITTDYTFFNYLKKHSLYFRLMNMKTEKYFIANCISDSIQIINGQVTDTKNNLTYDLKDMDKIVICKSAKDVGFDFEHFNSGYNSGFSSFQLALIMGYKKIYLLGMDMNFKNNSTHYHDGYQKSESKMNQNLINYSNHFINVVKKLKIERPDIEIISCSPISILNDFIPYQDIKDIL